MALNPAHLFDDRGDTKRWRRSLSAVAAAHGVALVIAASWSGAHLVRLPEPPPIAIDLAPLPIAQEIAPSAQASAAAPAPAPAAKPVPQQTVVQKSEPTPIIETPRPIVPVSLPAARPSPAPAAAPSAAAGTGSSQAGTTGTASGAATGASTGSSAGESARGGGNAAAVWRGRVLAHLDRHKRYPQAAKLMKREGRVQISLTLDRRGKVLSVEVNRGASFKPFDTEALDTVRRADPLPPPPPEVAGDTIPMQVPIGFYLPGTK
ncbi:energy transducer TonB [Sphingobium sp. AP50]|uniref:energy transducer TonB n=1 Tax=Sphingobium sp. AP50 TaxID=1884369 RepID=UPI00210ACB58|nr:TonB family protein [Sphingobium sp. AP50]